MLKKGKPLLHCTESLKRVKIKKLVYRWNMNITNEF